MEYLDFEVEISPSNQGNYLVAVIRSPAGEARESIRFPSELQLESRLKDLKIALLRSGAKRRRVLTPEEQTVQNFGRELFDLLLPNEIRGLYRTSLNKALAQNCGLRLKLRLKETPELAALPWEFLYDPNDAEYVCLSQDTSIVRYLELPRPPVPLKVATPLRILGMVSSPTDLPKLDVAWEKERVNRAVADLQTAGQVELTWLEGQTWRDLKKALRQKWHIFHFIGHGGFDKRRDEGFVALCDASGQSHRFMASKLAQLLANQRSLRLTLLNACEGGHGSGQDIFSSAASILVRRGMPAVLAMQYEISDRAAIELARSFYEALAAGLPVDAAVTEARQSIGFAAQDSIEWVTPVLYMRSPDGKLFTVQTGAVPPLSQATPPPKQLLQKQPEAPPETSAESFTVPNLAQLRQQMVLVFNENELRDLCFNLNVDYEVLGGEGKIGQARELVTYLDRRGRVNELVAICEKERPHLNWRQITRRQAEKPPPKSPALSEVPGTSGDTFIHEKTGLKFVRVPAGEFEYGDKGEKRKLPEYLISKTPVTHTVYKRFIDANPKYTVPFRKEDWAKPYNWDQKKRTYPADKVEHPVLLVSWYDAVAFCEWAGLQLPTEEQWEKAARGTKGLKYPWGHNDPTDKLCNFNKNVGKTTPVGQYSPQGDSPYGCVDMSGNVWEWCLNKYETPEDTAVDKSDARRVRRGGSWNVNRGYARAAYRVYFVPVDRLDSIGFRVVVRSSPISIAL
ncbi:MAG: SUMF1/EgtB/PvdO family nonheme iron enzyme [Chloroflexi bacterium]|nr:SUMF1/EgtB/PvdO family nonheme iron enzyme [Chloroflexota bacterium]